METLDSGQTPNLNVSSSNGSGVSADSSLNVRADELDVSVSGIRNNGERISGEEAENRVVGLEKGDKSVIFGGGKDGVSLFGGEVLGGNRVEEIGVLEVESEVLAGKNGKEGSGSVKGAVMVGGVVAMDSRLKVDGPFASNTIIQDKAEGIAGLGALEGESANFPLGKVLKLGFGDSGVSAGDGGGKTVGEVVKEAVGGELAEGQVLGWERERVQEIAVCEAGLALVHEKQNAASNATNAHIPLMDIGEKLVSPKAVATSVHGEHVGEKDSLLERGALRVGNSSVGVQGNELSVAGIEGVEQEEQEGEQIDAQKSRFKVGDFVWGKVKGHSWWPGQIYDHSDASEYAAKHSRRNCFLVVYFANKTFGWCYPSQLRSFHEGFQLLWRQSCSKSFLSAMEAALNELGRCVKLEMICSCVPVEARATLVRPVTVNAGLKEGVSSPQGRIGELSITEFDPANFLTRLRGLARVVSEIDMLELTVFIGRISAFRWVRGYGRLPMPKEISKVSGAVDSAEDQISDNNNFDDQRGHTQEPDEEGGVSSPVDTSVGKSGRNTSRRGSHNMGDKYQRKKRSMAELLQGDMDIELESNTTNVTEEGKVTDKLHLSSKKHTKIEHAGSPSTMMDNEDENDNDDARDGKSAPSLRQRKSKHFAFSSMPEEISTSTSKDDDFGQGGGILTSPRIRKKSKYLSPPYTMLGGLAGMLSSKDVKAGTSKAPRASRAMDSLSGKDVETETPKSTDDSENGEAGQLIVSPLIRRCSVEISQKKVALSVHGEQKAPGSSSPQTPEFDASADEMLSELLSAALDPLYLKGNRSSNAVKGFFTKYRSSSYSFDISKCVADVGSTERKLPQTEHDSLEKDSRVADANEDKFGPGDGNRISVSAVPSSVGKDSNQAGQSVPKSVSGGGKRKPQSNKCFSLGKDLQADQSVPKSGFDVIEGKSLPKTPFSLGNDSNGAYQSVPKSVSGGRKRKTLSNIHVSPGKDSSAADQSQGKIGQKTKRRTEKGCSKKTSSKSGWPTSEKRGPVEWVAGNSGVEVNQKEANGDNPVALFLTFTPGFPLPSKEDFIRIFSKFGGLIESETVVSRESGSARVVFTRSSDAEAFNNSDKNSAFGPHIVSCQMQSLSGVPTGFEMNSSFHLPPTALAGIVTPPPSSKAVNGPPLHVIRQNLEIMMSMLSESSEKETSVEKLSPEVQANLTGEIKGLLKKVTTLMDSSS